MKPLRIGQVASDAGIGVEAVRFYERQGLVEAPPRSASGYREYPPTVVARFRFIKRAKELGFTLREIKELLSLRLDPATTCGNVKGLTEAKITDIEARIQGLRRIKRALVQLTAACSGQGASSECPILEARDQEEEVRCESN